MKDTRTTIDQRGFVLGVSSILASSVLHAEALRPPTPKDGIVRFGLLADLHHSFMPDAQLRFDSFLHAVQDCMHILKDSRYVNCDNGNYFHFEDAQINRSTRNRRSG